MMNLRDAAKFFNKNEFSDTYGTATFEGQLLPYSDSTRSGNSTKRRILEVAPDVVMPVQGTVTSTATSDVYIVADEAPDLFLGLGIRSKYPVLPVAQQFSIRTIGQVLADTGGTEGVYMSPSYVRRIYFEDQSDYVGGFEVYYSFYYEVSRGSILHDGTKYYRARESGRIDDIGFGVVEAVHLESPITTMDFQAKGSVYNPVTDDRTPPAPVPDVNVFVEHITLDFVHESLSYVPLEAGDRAISFLKSEVASVTVGDTIGSYVIKSIDDNSDFWTVFGRKV